MVGCCRQRQVTKWAGASDHRPSGDYRRSGRRVCLLACLYPNAVAKFDIDERLSLPIGKQQHSQVELRKEAAAAQAVRAVSKQH